MTLPRAASSLREQIQQLIAEWRKQAKDDAVNGVQQAALSHREYFGRVNAALAYDDCANRLAALLAADGEAEPPTLEIIVNGQPVTVQGGPIRTAIAAAIQEAGQIGAPIDQWVLRTRDGEEIPHTLPDGEEYALAGGQRLFLHLGLPRAVAGTPEEPR
jgi:hypothetical protein